MDLVLQAGSVCLANKAGVCVPRVGALDSSRALLPSVHVSVVGVLGMTLQRFYQTQ